MRVKVRGAGEEGMLLGILHMVTRNRVAAFNIDVSTRTFA
jgi:hypothetical protein